MGAEASKLAPSDEERAALEAAGRRKAQEDIQRYAEEAREEGAQQKSDQENAMPTPPTGQHQDQNEDLEDGEVPTDNESESTSMPIRSGNSQTSPQADDLLRSFQARKERAPKKQPEQDRTNGGHTSDSTTRGSAKQRPRVDTSLDSIEVASRRASDSPALATAPTSAATASKRPAPESIDAHRKQSTTSAVFSMPKIPKRSSVASPQSPFRSENEEERHSPKGQPPQWYNALTTLNSRRSNDSGVDTLLSSLRSEIRRAKDLNNSRDDPGLRSIFAEIRHKLHTIIFQEVTTQVLKNNRMLDNQNGLPRIFNQQYSDGVEWPFDIKADARELYNKWCRRDFGTDIMRGIKFSVTVKGTKKEGGDSIDPNYKNVVEARRHGNNGLINGQWWPFQICALRDGAHGALQGGISGATNEGAFSCILSGGMDSKGQPYPDEDEGNIVWYCGTDSDNGEPTPYTQRMLESVNNEPVRLIRSHKAHTRYAPKQGLRYDGLYYVTEYERMDPKSSKRQRHRFKLVRKENQDPIRGGNGPEQRPTAQEIEQYERHQRLSGKGKAQG